MVRTMEQHTDATADQILPEDGSLEAQRETLARLMSSDAEILRIVLAADEVRSYMPIPYMGEGLAFRYSLGANKEARF